LFVIESTARPQVLVDIPAAYADRLRPGKAVQLFKTGSEEKIEGCVDVT
jgi:hypothetical protein